MTRNAKTILSEIKKLTVELEDALNLEPDSPLVMGNTQRSATLPKGAIGAIHMLIEEGYFNEPKDVSAIMERLKEIGHYHGKSTVAMNLLNLTKRRTLNRLKDNDSKNWEYVIRK